MAKKSTKGTKKMSSKKAANAHYLQQTEESVRNHTASQKKHKEVYDEYKHEYSEESAHSMAKTPVFRSTKNHQQDLVNAGRQMGIQVNVRHYGPNAGAKRPVSVKSTKGHKQKSNVEPLTVNVSQGSSMPTPTRGNTVTRPFQLSSPRIKVSTTSESEHSPSPKSPMRDSKTIIYKSAEHGGAEHTCEKILKEQVLRMKILLLKSHAFKTSHDPISLGSHITDRAQELIKEELHQRLQELHRVQGTSATNRYSALGQYSVSLLSEIESEIFTEEKAKSRALTYDERIRLQGKDNDITQLQEEIAARDQRINQLTHELDSASDNYEAIAVTNEALRSRLEKSERNQTIMNQNAVELRMQGLDFKARCENRLKRVLKQIATRMGFVPGCISKEVNALSNLKAPGDPGYNEVLQEAYTRKSLKKFQKLLGQTTSEIMAEEFVEEDMLIDPFTGQMTTLDGKIVPEKSLAESQEEGDKKRWYGYSPARDRRQVEEEKAIENVKFMEATGIKKLTAEIPKPVRSTFGFEEKEYKEYTSESSVGGSSTLRSSADLSINGTRKIDGRKKTPKSQEEWLRWANLQGVSITAKEYTEVPAESLNSRAPNINTSQSSGMPSGGVTSPNSGVRVREAFVEEAGGRPVYQARNASLSSTNAVVGSELGEAGDIEMKSFGDDINDEDEEDDSDYDPNQDNDDDDDEDDDDEYEEENLGISMPKQGFEPGKFYELDEGVRASIDSSVGRYSDLAQESVDVYETGKLSGVGFVSGRSNRYQDPRGSVRTSTSSSIDLSIKPPTAPGEELQDIKAFLAHVREQRGVTEEQLRKYSSSSNFYKTSAANSALSDAIGR